MSVLRLTQVTDLHLGPEPDYRTRGVATLSSFKAVLQQIDQQGRGADLLLLTGDLASDCQPGAYQQLNQLLKAQNRRALWLPGNHDDVTSMTQYLPNYPRCMTFESGNWGILMIDSCKLGQPGGELSQSELQRVAEGLQQLAGKFVLVAMHHSPVDLHSKWLDRHRIANRQQLHQLLSAHGNVRAVVFGHVHQQYEADWQGIPVYAAPSSCVQFESFSDEFAVSDQPPGYRYLELHPDGRLITTVEYLTVN